MSFEDVPTKAKQPLPSGGTKKKRKRVTADDLQSQLDTIDLPSSYDRFLQKSGSHAIVTFVDTASAEASLKAASRASKKGKATPITWGEGIEDRLPALGLSRYLSCDEKRYPDRATLLRTVNDYMTMFEAVAEARKKEESRRAQEPDEDGFVTVSHGPKLNSVAREEEVRALVEKERKKREGLEDFYRFQSREKRKEKQVDLVKRFEGDKRRLEEVKRRKGKMRVSFSPTGLGVC